MIAEFIDPDITLHWWIYEFGYRTQGNTLPHTTERNLLDLSLYWNLLFTYITLMMLPPKSSSTRFVSFLKAVGSISLQGGAHHHRVDRVPGFLLSRPNWVRPPPHRQASVGPLWVRGDTHSLSGGGGQNHFRRGIRNCGTLGIVKSLYHHNSTSKWEFHIISVEHIERGPRFFVVVLFGCNFPLLAAISAGESNFLIFSDSFFPLSGQPMETDGREAVEPNKTTAK